MIYVIGPQETAPVGANVINTTSRSNTWSKSLSPFFLGPVDLYSGFSSKNVENAWQYSKVYQKYADSNGDPTPEYFVWAQNGWNSDRAFRYPMGVGAAPLYSYWAGAKYDYITARQKIYMPLYAESVKLTSAYSKLKKLAAGPDDLYLWDFDAYNHKALGLTYDQVINDPTKKMGHAFVLAMLLDGFIQ